MSELNPKARALVQSGRGAGRPSAADRARIQSALEARLGAALLAGAATSGASAARPHWQLVSSIVVGVGLVGGALFFALRPVPAPAPATPAPVAPAVASAPPASAPPASATPLEAPAPSAVAPALAPSSDAPAAASDAPVVPAHRSQDRLAQEVALLGKATSALHAGRASDALKTLDEYQRKFPGGLLAEEWHGARAQALCALGRQSEAQSELARLAPQSPAAARAKQVCSASTLSGR